MTFTEAREALNSGKQIRHPAMAGGDWIMLYPRPYGYAMKIMVDENGCLSGNEANFIDMFWSAIGDDDEWEVR